MIEKAKAVTALAEYCLAKGSGTYACDDFWRMSWFVAAIVIAAMILVVIVIALRRNARFRRSQALWLEHLRQQDEVAPELRMQHVSWKGDAYSAADKDEAELAEQIRQGLRNRKLNGG